MLLALACSRRDGGDPVAPSARPQQLVYYERVKDDIAQLTKMVRLKPDDAELHVRLGEKLREGMLGEAAEREFAQALLLDPGHVEAADRLFTVRFERGELDGAWQVISGSLAAHESSVMRAREGLYLTNARPDDRPAAERAYERALELDRSNVDAAFELGRLKLKDRDLEAACRLFRDVIRQRPNHLGGHSNLAAALRQAGDAQEADMVAREHRRLSHLDDLGHLDDYQSPEAALVLAYMYRSGKDDAAALAELQAGLARYPRHAELLTEHAMAVLRVRGWEDALATFNAALKLAPESALLLNRFAWVLATRSQLPDERRRAVQLAERAVSASDRQDPNILDTLAEARAATGNYAGAVAALNEALRLAPADAALARRRDLFQKRASE